MASIDGAGERQLSARLAALDIREMRANEGDAVIALWHAAQLTRPWNDPQLDMQRCVDCPTSTILVATIGDSQDAARPVGTVMVGFDGHRGWFYYLAVSPDHRRAGIGRALVHAAQEWLRANGANKAQLMIRSDNEQAHAFYAALGYERQAVDVVGMWLDGGGPDAQGGTSS